MSYTIQKHCHSFIFSTQSIKVQNQIAKFQIKILFKNILSNQIEIGIFQISRRL